MRTTVKLKAVSVGTEVNIEQEGIPEMIPPEACYLGWQDSLHKLEKLVVPEINQRTMSAFDQKGLTTA
jgi:hypothetical protein